MKYEEYAEKIGFKKEGKIFVKEVDGFKMYLKNWQYIVLSIPSFYIPLNKPISKEQVNKISKALFDTACAPGKLKVEGDVLIISLPDGKKGSEKWTLLAVNQTLESVKILKEEGFEPMKECPLCGKEATYGEFGDNYCPIHPECKEAYIKKVEEKIKEEDKQVGKGILSILVTTLLSLIGALPAFLLGYFLYDFFTGVVAVIPILNSIGYFLMKAPNKKWVRLITGIVPFIIMVCLGIFIIPHMAQGNNLSLFDYCFTSGWVGFRKIIFMTILSFGGFGGVRFFSKYKVNYERELEKLKE